MVAYCRYVKTFNGKHKCRKGVAKPCCMGKSQYDVREHKGEVNMRKGLQVAGACLIVTSTLSGAFAQFGIPGEVIAVQGGPAFALPGERFTFLGNATISQNGVVGFYGTTAIGSASGLKGVFKWDAGVGSRIVQQGQPFAGLPMYTYHDFRSPIIDNQGGFTFIAANSPGDFGGLVTGTAGQLSLAAFSGADPNPTPSYLKVSEVIDFRYTRMGRIAIQDAASDQRLWTGTLGNFQLVASNNVQAPGYPSGTIMAGVGSSRVSESGKMTAIANIRGNGYLGERVMLSASPASTSIAVGPGRPTPGLAGAFDQAGEPASLNGAGVLAFVAPYREVSGGSQQLGIWVGHEHELQPAVITGAQVPGLPTGCAFDYLTAAVVNHRGSVLFGGSVTGPGGAAYTGSWIYREGVPRPVLQRGNAVVNMPEGTWLESSSGSFAFNDLDQLAMVGMVTMPGGELRQAILALDPTLGLRAFAAEGFAYQIAPGDSRIVSSISAYPTGFGSRTTTGDDGLGTFLNDRGEMVFTLQFTDGSAATIVCQVPSPGAMLFPLGLIALVGRSRPQPVDLV